MGIKPRISRAEIEFINENAEEKEISSKKKNKRDYKTLTIPMNKTEYDLLITLANQYEQSLNGIIRYALKKLAEIN